MRRFTKKIINNEMWGIQMRIVHLSDIHLNNDKIKDFKRHTIKPLLRDLAKHNSAKKIDLIFVTGDLIDKGGKSFNNIEDAFNQFIDKVIEPIKSELNIDNDRFYFVPGNHDINKKADSKNIEEGLTINLESITKINEFIDEKNNNENDMEGIKRILPYKKFEENFYIDDLRKKNISKFQSSYIIEIDGKKVGINCFNTAWRCYNSKTDKEKILLGERQVVM